VADLVLSPGATAADAAVALLPATAAAAAVVVAAAAAPAGGGGGVGVGWSTRQAALAAVLAFDLFGGAVVNASTPGKRAYHGRGTTAARRLAFVAAHGAHVAAVAAAWPGVAPADAAAAYAVLLAAAVAVASAPRRVQRPVAVAVVAAVAAAAAEGCRPWRAVPGMAWFLPVLFVKLILGHLVSEEPYVGDAPAAKRH